MAVQAENARDVEQYHRDLGEAAVVALEPRIGPAGGALAAVIRNAAVYATPDARAGELVIDKRALLHGLLLTAQREQRFGLVWLADWADEQGWVPEWGIDTAGFSDIDLVGSPTRIILSRSVMSDLLPEGRASLAGLVAAVLHTGAGWAELGMTIRPDAFIPVRSSLQDWMSSGAEHVEPSQELASPESLATQSDDPASTDRLGRLPFAQVLAERIREARANEEARPGQSRAFMAHLHGPWGSGKSSILRFLREELQNAGPAWVTVDFNAWQNQSLRPIWWSIINEVRRQAASQVDAPTRRRMALTWWSWKLRADLLPVLLAVGLFIVAVFGIVGSTMGADKVFALVTAAIAAGGAIFALSRTVVFGSSHAARAYAELKTDPYTPVIRLFCRLVEAIDRPLLVCVDDVDRCDSGTVVDLLEGIQTLLRDAPVTYAIAGDRKWICASFEKRYDDFNERIGGPGRPLGYLFLDKMFQISTAVPRMSKIVREQYWDSLLAGQTAPAAPAATDRDLTEIVTQEELQTIIDTAEKPEDRQALRAAAALQITRPAARSEAESRFRSFGALLERNPRSMKLMINALGLNQALLFLEGRDAPPEALARWTILELRWPLLADWLSAYPEADGACCPFPALLDDAEVKAVMGGADATGRLDPAMLKALHE